MKVGLISGHGAGDCGACGYGYEEANETVRIVKMLDERLQDCGIETVVYHTVVMHLKTVIEVWAYR